MAPKYFEKSHHPALVQAKGRMGLMVSDLGTMDRGIRMWEVPLTLPRGSLRLQEL